MKYCSVLFLLLLLVGTSAPADEPIPLRAGPLSMVFDADNAMLRYLRVGRIEVLRGINAPVRNQFWGTVIPKVTNVKVADGGDQFTVSFDASCRERDVDFSWKGRIVGDTSGHVVFTFDGEARSTFRRNRIGFCILHGPSAAGQRWIIEDTNGAKAPGRFPSFISPHQPAKNIREISHELAPGIWAHVRCEGDVFEMEDQRNWTDASFKTYCTPLEIPFKGPGEDRQQAMRRHLPQPQSDEIKSMVGARATWGVTIRERFAAISVLGFSVTWITRTTDGRFQANKTAATG